ncbi:unnamed protein product [Notodromas monacha]|uniref:Uncharacterized protein n=1 Tax=Notodromas monacha TaxID=399045 RepID=A0A7R9BKG1_9CRUS|nr:unnamed protein product [Notodromas monacha]CAG0915614.1 unnamed protein product [Notodromas monacha]
MGQREMFQVQDTVLSASLKPLTFMGAILGCNPLKWKNCVLIKLVISAFILLSSVEYFYSLRKVGNILNANNITVSFYKFTENVVFGAMWSLAPVFLVTIYGPILWVFSKISKAVNCLSENFGDPKALNIKEIKFVISAFILLSSVEYFYSLRKVGNILNANNITVSFYKFTENVVFGAMWSLAPVFLVTIYGPILWVFSKISKAVNCLSENFGDPKALNIKERHTLARMLYKLVTFAVFVAFLVYVTIRFITVKNGVGPSTEQKVTAISTVLEFSSFAPLCLSIYWIGNYQAEILCRFTESFMEIEHKLASLGMRQHKLLEWKQVSYIKLKILVVFGILILSTEFFNWLITNPWSTVVETNGMFGLLKELMGVLVDHLWSLVPAFLAGIYFPFTDIFKKISNALQVLSEEQKLNLTLVQELMKLYYDTAKTLKLVNRIAGFTLTLFFVEAVTNWVFEIKNMASSEVSSLQLFLFSTQIFRVFVVISILVDLEIAGEVPKDILHQIVMEHEEGTSEWHHNLSKESIQAVGTGIKYNTATFFWLMRLYYDTAKALKLVNRIAGFTLTLFFVEAVTNWGEVPKDILHQMVMEHEEGKSEWHHNLSKEPIQAIGTGIKYNTATFFWVNKRKQPWHIIKLHFKATEMLETANRVTNLTAGFFYVEAISYALYIFQNTFITTLSLRYGTQFLFMMARLGIVTFCMADVHSQLKNWYQHLALETYAATALGVPVTKSTILTIMNAMFTHLMLLIEEKDDLRVSNKMILAATAVTASLAHKPDGPVHEPGFKEDPYNYFEHAYLAPQPPKHWVKVSDYKPQKVKNPMSKHEEDKLKKYVKERIKTILELKHMVPVFKDWTEQENYEVKSFVDKLSILTVASMFTASLGAILPLWGFTVAQPGAGRSFPSTPIAQAILHKMSALVAGAIQTEPRIRRDVTRGFGGSRLAMMWEKARESLPQAPEGVEQVARTVSTAVVAHEECLMRAVCQAGAVLGTLPPPVERLSRMMARLAKTMKPSQAYYLAALEEQNCEKFKCGNLPAMKFTYILGLLLVLGTKAEKGSPTTQDYVWNYQSTPGADDYYYVAEVEDVPLDISSYQQGLPTEDYDYVEQTIHNVQTGKPMALNTSPVSLLVKPSDYGNPVPVVKPFDYGNPSPGVKTPDYGNPVPVVQSSPSPVPKTSPAPVYSPPLPAYAVPEAPKKPAEPEKKDPPKPVVEADKEAKDALFKQDPYNYFEHDYLKPQHPKYWVEVSDYKPPKVKNPMSDHEKKKLKDFTKERIKTYLKLKSMVPIFKDWEQQEDYEIGTFVDKLSVMTVASIFLAAIGTILPLWAFAVVQPALAGRSLGNNKMLPQLDALVMTLVTAVNSHDQCRQRAACEAGVFFNSLPAPLNTVVKVASRVARAANPQWFHMLRSFEGRACYRFKCESLPTSKVLVDKIKPPSYMRMVQWIVGGVLLWVAFVVTPALTEEKKLDWETFINAQKKNPETQTFTFGDSKNPHTILMDPPAESYFGYAPDGRPVGHFIYTYPKDEDKPKATEAPGYEEPEETTKEDNKSKEEEKEPDASKEVMEEMMKDPYAKQGSFVDGVALFLFPLIIIIGIGLFIPAIDSLALPTKRSLDDPLMNMLYQVLLLIGIVVLVNSAEEAGPVYSPKLKGDSIKIEDRYGGKFQDDPRPDYNNGFVIGNPNIKYVTDNDHDDVEHQFYNSPQHQFLYPEKGVFAHHEKPGFLKGHHQDKDAIPGLKGADDNYDPVKEPFKTYIYHDHPPYPIPEFPFGGLHTQYQEFIKHNRYKPYYGYKGHLGLDPKEAQHFGKFVDGLFAVGAAMIAMGGAALFFPFTWGPGIFGRESPAARAFVAASDKVWPQVKDHFQQEECLQRLLCELESQGYERSARFLSADPDGSRKMESSGNFLDKALGSIGNSELMGKLKGMLDNLKNTLEEDDDETDWKPDFEEEHDEHNDYSDIEHEQDNPYPDIPIIDVPGKKKIGPPLTFGNYNRMGVGSFVDAVAICVATVVWLTFFGLVLPLFYGGQLGKRRRRSTDSEDTLDTVSNMVTKILENEDCFEYILCNTAQVFPQPKPAILSIARLASKLPNERLKLPGSRVVRALTSSCQTFACFKRK